jgi:hypothetical protein
MSAERANATRSGRIPQTLRRLGLAGFCFFLAKGLLWLVASAAIVEGCRAA